MFGHIRECHIFRRVDQRRVQTGLVGRLVEIWEDSPGPTSSRFHVSRYHVAEKSILELRYYLSSLQDLLAQEICILYGSIAIVERRPEESSVIVSVDQSCVVESQHVSADALFSNHLSTFP